MEGLKLSLRIVSIVVLVIVYYYVWKYIIGNFSESFDDDVLYQVVSIIWIVLHIVGFVTAVVWAWC